MNWLKSVGISLTVLAVIFAAPSAAFAQSYGDVLPIVSEIATGTADDDGQFRYRYTAPDDIEEDFLVYVVGTDEDGEPFEWVVAAVTSSFAGLTWTLAGADMEPGSDFVLEARSAGADASADASSDGDDGADDDASADDSDSDSDDSDDAAASGDDSDEGDEDAAASVGDEDDGQDVRGLVGLALVLAVIAAALVYGIRLTNSRRS